MKKIICSHCSKEMMGYTEKQASHMLQQHLLTHGLEVQNTITSVKKKKGIYSIGQEKK